MLGGEIRNTLLVILSIEPRRANTSPAAKSTSTKKAAPIPPASTVTVDVYNGGTANGLATGVLNALTAKGYKAGLTGNSSAQLQKVTQGTQVFYGAGASANAAKIAGYFGATAKSVSSLTAGHVEVLLGTGATVVPSSLTPTVSPQSAPSVTSSGDNGAVGGAVTVGAKAKFGIPCVY